MREGESQFKIQDLTPRGSNYKEDDGWCVLLSKKEHNIIKNKIYKELPLRSKAYTPQEVWAGYKIAYKDYPEFLEEIHDIYFKEFPL